MSRFFYFLLSFAVIITIFITVFQSQDLNYIYANSVYFWPTPAYHNISSRFGYRTSPTEGASSYHQGIDIAAAVGSGVSVMADGEVTFAGFHKNGGYMIVVKHSSKMKSYYEHLSKEMYVEKGDKVSKGDVIGTVGAKVIDGKLNGVTTGAHLHFGVMINGEYVDPLNLY